MHRGILRVVVSCLVMLVVFFDHERPSLATVMLCTLKCLSIIAVASTSHEACLVGRSHCLVSLDVVGPACAVS